MGRYLFDFRTLKPQFAAPQIEGLRWLAWIHSRCQGDKSQAIFEKHFSRFGCGPEKIATRAYEHPLYCKYTEETIQRFSNFPLSERMRFFEQVAEQRMREFYSDKRSAPRLLVHVSCTGYVSPSAAQKVVVEKGWHQETGVLHAYHMGCYASLPAIRHAMDHVREESRVDIFHSELCTLHLDTRLHSPEQIVVQSLFADGHVGYSVCEAVPGERSFEILAVREELVPDSFEAMTWRASEFGFQMTLAREIPEIIQAAITGFLQRLCSQANIDQAELTAALFAVHPGGPRIIDLVQDVLRLKPEQTSFSRLALLSFGNMSSATLPHVWQAILKSESADRLVVSFAFGPGLTVFGSVMRLRAK